MKKKYMTDFCKDIFIFFSYLCYGAPARSRTQNLLVRSQALYPIELQAQFLNSNLTYSFFNVI